MSTDRPTSLASILAEWNELAGRGEVPDVEDYCARHPDLADDLRAHHQAMEILREAGPESSVPPLEPDGEVDGPRAHLHPLRPDRYVDFAPAGKGGMGIVYWALDTDLNRQVAFKVVRPDVGSDGGLPEAHGPLDLSPPGKDTPASKAFETLKARFLQEAWVTGGLEHPGIVPVYELGETEQGVPYYTMRFVRGERTLATAIAESKERPFEERLPLLEPFLKVCDTLEYAHAQGVIHRDLKPENIALGSYGEVVVLDWGMAKLQGQQDRAAELWQDHIEAFRRGGKFETMHGGLGTPGYMSPEAAFARMEQVNERSDVYSLGAILFEALTGELPHRFDNYGELLQRMQSEPAPSVRERDADVPAGLAAICERALSDEAADRFPSTASLAQGLRDWQTATAQRREASRHLDEARAVLEGAENLEGDGLLGQMDAVLAALDRSLRAKPDSEEAQELRERAVARRAAALEQQRTNTRRRSVRRAAIISTAAIALLSIVFAFVLDAKRREAVDAEGRAVEAEGETRTALQGVKTESAAKEDALQRLRVRSMVNLAQDAARDGHHARAFRLAERALSIDPESAGARGAMLEAADQPLEVRLGLASRPGPRRTKLVRTAGTWWNVRRSRTRRIWDDDDEPSGFPTAVAQDLSRFLIHSTDTRGNHWRLVDADHREIAATDPDEAGAALSAAGFLPGGASFFVAYDAGHVEIRSCENGRLQHTLDIHRAAVEKVRAARDGSRLATLAKDRRICVWDSAGGLLWTIWLRPLDYVSELALDATGTHVALGMSDGFVEMWTAAGKRLWRAQVGRGRVNYLSFLEPDRVVARAAGGAAAALQIASGKKLILADPDAGIFGKAVGEAGLVRRSGLGPLSMVDLSGRAVGTLPESAPPLSEMTLSRSGAFAALDADGALRLWLEPSRKPLRAGDPEAPLKDIAFLPDGDSIVSVNSLGDVRHWRWEDGALTAETWSPTLPPQAPDDVGVLDGGSVVVRTASGCTLAYDARGGLAFAELSAWAGNDTEERKKNPRRRNFVRISRDRSRALLCTEDGILVLDRGGRPERWIESRAAAVKTCDISSDGSRIAAVDARGTLSVWGADGTLEYTLDAARQSDGGVRIVRFEMDGHRLAVISHRNVLVIAPRRGVVNEIALYQDEREYESQPSERAGGKVESFTWSPAGTHVAVTAKGLAGVWQAEGGLVRHVKGDVVHAEFALDTGCVYLSLSDGAVHVASLVSYIEDGVLSSNVKRITTMNKHKATATTFALALDNIGLVATTHTDEAMLHYWNVDSSGMPLSFRAKHLGSVALPFVPDQPLVRDASGDVFARKRDRRVRIAWRRHVADRSDDRDEPDPDHVFGLVEGDLIFASPDRTRVLVRDGPSGYRILDAQGAELSRGSVAPYELTEAWFAPDARHVLIRPGPQQAFVIDSESGAVVGRLASNGRRPTWSVGFIGPDRIAVLWNDASVSIVGLDGSVIAECGTTHRELGNVAGFLLFDAIAGRLATASTRACVDVWNASGERLFRVHAPGAVWGGWFRPDGGVVLSGLATHPAEAEAWWAFDQRGDRIGGEISRLVGPSGWRVDDPVGTSGLFIAENYGEGDDDDLLGVLDTTGVRLKPLAGWAWWSEDAYGPEYANEPQYRRVDPTAVLVGREGKLGLLDLRKGLQRTWSVDEDPALAIAPGATHFALIDLERRLHVVDQAGRGPEPMELEAGDSPKWLALAPGGRHVAHGDGVSSAVVVDAQTGASRRIESGTGAVVGEADWISAALLQLEIRTTDSWWQRLYDLGGAVVAEYWDGSGGGETAVSSDGRFRARQVREDYEVRGEDGALLARFPVPATPPADKRRYTLRLAHGGRALLVVQRRLKAGKSSWSKGTLIGCTWWLFRANAGPDPVAQGTLGEKATAHFVDRAGRFTLFDAKSGELRAADGSLIRPLSPQSTHSGPRARTVSRRGLHRFVADGSILRKEAMDRDDAVIWERDVGGPVGKVVISSKLIAIRTGQSEVVLLDSAGEELGRAALPAEITGSKLVLHPRGLGGAVIERAGEGAFLFTRTGKAVGIHPKRRPHGGLARSRGQARWWMDSARLLTAADELGVVAIDVVGLPQVRSILGLAGGSSAGPDRRSIRTALALPVTAWGKGAPEQALAHLRDLVAKTPGTDVAWWLGLVLDREGTTAKMGAATALAHMEAADVDLLEKLAFKVSYPEYPEVSVEITERLLRTNPGAPAERLGLWKRRLAALYTGDGKDAEIALRLIREAGMHYAEACAASPERSGVHVDRARTHASRLKRLAGTSAPFGEFLEDAQASAAAWAAAARLRYGYADEAKSAAEAAQALDALAAGEEPETAALQLRAGYLLYRWGRYEKSAECFELAIQSPEIRSDLRRANLYNAACSAALVTGPNAAAWHEKSVAWVAEELNLRLQRWEAERAALTSTASRADRVALRAREERMRRHFRHAQQGDDDLDAIRKGPRWKAVREIRLPEEFRN